jgi:DUF2950 family protein
MKNSHQFTRIANILTIAIVAAACGVLPTRLHAADQKAAFTQRTFASPEEAIKALREATQAKDKDALHEIFGPEGRELLTGDEAQDATNAEKFAAAMAVSCTPVPEGDNKVVLEIGAKNWPFPIPLVKADSHWYFDTAAGKDEIINRHIGKDELHAIGACRAFVEAQRQYASMNHDTSGAAIYARKLKSTDGKKDGLYWTTPENEPASPFALMVAAADADGHGCNDKGPGLQAFHGYLFKVLTRQGNAASGGKMNYMSHGNLTAGFALVAWPEYWGQSGVMTFIVNQDGKVYRRNLGEKSCRIAGAMTQYNPDSQWTLETDQGVFEK